MSGLMQTEKAKKRKQEEMIEVRAASHAGSWYEKDGKKLGKQLSDWLVKAKDESNVPPPIRAIIAPHAGYSYSGSTAAFAYKHLGSSDIKRVFLLGPSHHVSLAGCALSRMKEYETPFGNLTLDLNVIADLEKTGLFSKMSKDMDEDEHSLELHLPYIHHMFNGQVLLVPILVGSPSAKSQEEYANALAPYLDSSENFFIISSDFCHWGKRFSYTHYEPSCGEIWQSIENLDRKGISVIESLDPEAFLSYLREYKNTICGRYPISLLLHTVKKSKRSDYKMKFVHYKQSSQCTNKHDSSVSYASGVLSF